jgi:hypothetical protein
VSQVYDRGDLSPSFWKRAQLANSFLLLSAAALADFAPR